jgi:hypothetical protein
MQCGALHIHRERKARSRLMQNIHNVHKVTAEILLSIFQQFNRTGRVKPRAAANHVDEGTDWAVEEAFASSVEWIMVRMDLLARYK